MIALWCRAGVAAVNFTQPQYGTDYEMLTCATDHSPTLHRFNQASSCHHLQSSCEAECGTMVPVWRTALSLASPPAPGEVYAELHHEALNLWHQARLADQPRAKASFEHDPGLPLTWDYLASLKLSPISCWFALPDTNYDDLQLVEAAQLDLRGNNVLTGRCSRDTLSECARQSYRSGAL